MDRKFDSELTFKVFDKWIGFLDNLLRIIAGIIFLLENLTSFCEYPKLCTWLHDLSWTLKRFLGVWNFKNNMNEKINESTFLIRKNGESRNQELTSLEKFIKTDPDSDSRIEK